MSNELFIIRITDSSKKVAHASIYATSVAELQTKFDSWKKSANGQVYGGHTITAYKYVNDKLVSERVMQA